MTEIKGKLDKFTIRVGDTPISKIDRTSKWKKSGYGAILVNILNPYFCCAAPNMLFRPIRNNLPEYTILLVHEARLYKLQRIVQADHNRIKLEIN